MAEDKSLDGAGAGIGGRLHALRPALDAAEVMLTKAARERRLPDRGELAAEDARLQADAKERTPVEEALAGEIAAFTSAVEKEKAAFEQRDVANRHERLVGYFSKATSSKLVSRRWAKHASLARLSDLLRRADGLTGLLAEERQFLLRKRKSFESALGQFIDHRDEVHDNLGDAPSASERLQAVTAVEEFIRIFDRLVQALNRGISVCNALLHKLAVDVEDLLILYHVVIEVEGEPGRLDRDAQGLAHLGAVLDRFRSGKLIGRDLERLRDATDARFFGWFPVHGPQTPAAEPVVAETPDHHQ